MRYTDTDWNPTCAHAMGQDYSLTRPSPGTNPTIYPSFPALDEDAYPKGIPSGR